MKKKALEADIVEGTVAQILDKRTSLILPSSPVLFFSDSSQSP